MSDSSLGDDEPLFVLVKILKPMSSEDRHRLIRSAMTYVGEELMPPNTGEPRREDQKVDQGDDLSSRNFSLKAEKWLKQVGLTSEQLDNVYNFTPEGFDLLVMPGKNKKEMTLNVYLLYALGNFLRTGLANFSDDSAREACEVTGCYDSSNHSTTIKDRGNIFSGEKKAGWTISAAGFARAAALIKQYSEVAKVS